ncbi:peptidase M15A [Pantanalinema sp. GBBB05]|uniref:peptidase M15A n=1 Tax=Pantanalinema sp. GBBB05 TaxID=2604139 RepID=UPI001D4FB9BF|nr:peptidase M15A [Pantanalinema sp. GBBB05]
MSLLNPYQRQDLYLREAIRAGIHKPILAALYATHSSPTLIDQETGLGISPANRITPEQVKTLAGQIRYAANTVRSFTNHLISERWRATDLWNREQGRYTDKFLQTIAYGYAAPPSDPTAAQLESCEYESLIAAYLGDTASDFQAVGLLQDQTGLDQQLPQFIEHVPNHYLGLANQQAALLEMVRLWLKLDTRDATIAGLTERSAGIESNFSASTRLDLALLQFGHRVFASYSGYPHQREALLRAVQLWQQLPSREAAIVALRHQPLPTPNPVGLDAALIALIQRIPQNYEGKGHQRNALVEGFQRWAQLESRSAALVRLGINSDLFAQAHPDPATLTQTATQLDRALIHFLQQLPRSYNGTETQREALLHLTQRWYEFTTRHQTVQTLVEHQQQMATARRGTIEAPPVPQPLVLPNSDPNWTPKTIQLFAPIIPNGSLTWAKATHGGIYLPPNQMTVDTIVQVAAAFQQICDRLGRPFTITTWYCPAEISARMTRNPQNRHSLGDAIEGYCEGLTGSQLYWFLDPWWSGGLGCYAQLPYLIYVDQRPDRVRWAPT